MEEVLRVYGVKIKSDPTLPIGAWYIETPQIRELAAIVLKLDTFVRTYRMKVNSIDIGEDK